MLQRYQNLVHHILHVDVMQNQDKSLGQCSGNCTIKMYWKKHLNVDHQKEMGRQIIQKLPYSKEPKQALALMKHILFEK